MATYSFQSMSATLTGVGGSIDLAFGSGSAAEGITIEAVEDKNIMTLGADGSYMHTLVCCEASTIMSKHLKTSPVNAQLQTMYNLQTKIPSAHGSNILILRDVYRGDVITVTGVAFKKRPSNTWAKDGNILEWVFDGGRTTTILGNGTPEL